MVVNLNQLSCVLNIIQAEYMDPRTLWDRTNDAINTIIRHDESTETGQFLQPCIEGTLSAIASTFSLFEGIFAIGVCYF